MNNQDLLKYIDDATLLVGDVRSHLERAETPDGGGVDLRRSLDQLMVLHSKLREQLRSSAVFEQEVIGVSAHEAVAGSVSEVQSPPAHSSGDLTLAAMISPPADYDALLKQVDRVDLQLRKFNETSSQRVRALEKELRTRLDTLERRHDDLLNGRVFSTLRRILAVIRLPVRLFSSRVSVQGDSLAATTASATSLEAHPPAGGDNVVSRSLPSPQSVKIAGVSYMSRLAGGVSAASVTYPGKPLISVVMTCYNTADYVRAAAESILAQTWENLELIAVDDCSTDQTRDVLEDLASRDRRMKVYCFGENRGTYWSKNFGISKASGVVVTFMDSDDISLPERIEKQFSALNQVGRVVSTCNHVRKTPDGETIAINGVVERVAYISQMVKREVFEEIGFFDTVRTSADDEFLRRIRITYGADAQVNVKQSLYVALLRDGSLTSDPENAINFVQDRNAGQSFLSPQRRHYAAMCDRWHKFLVEKGRRPFVPFPVVRRPFPVYGKLVVAGEKYDGNQVSACLASYPPREEKLKMVVASLLPQVDQIYVYLNEYSEVPGFLKHSRITVKLGGPGGNIRDNGKFHFMDSMRDGYVFTVDDDIDYPPDYVQVLIRKIEFYDRRAIVGLHGTVYAKPVRSFFKGRTLLHFEDALQQDTVVNQLGTGTVAFHTSLVRPESAWFKDAGMADVWFAVEAKKRDLTLVAIERSALWLSPLGVEETTLFREFRKNDAVQTRAVRSVAPWKEIVRPPLNSLLAARRRALGPAYVRLLPRCGVEPEQVSSRQ